MKDEKYLTSELEIACLNLPRLVKIKKITGKDASREIQRIISLLRELRQEVSK